MMSYKPCFLLTIGVTCWVCYVHFRLRKIAQFTTTSARALISEPPILTLPFDLISEILYKLSVKQLLLLRCVCKSFNSLISDPNFAKNHLRLSTPRHHLIVSCKNKFPDISLFDITIPSVLSTSSVKPTKFHFPDSIKKIYGSPFRVCSCDGILCFVMHEGSAAVLWNPSIRKFKMLPPLKTERGRPISLYSFGYDPFIHDYKIVAISFFKDNTNAVSVYTLASNSWRRIQDFTYSCYNNLRSGVFVNGTVNWLGMAYLSLSPVYIVSLDLETESYQKIWQPALTKHECILGVLKDCLCIFEGSDMSLDVWVMKEYGKKDSWTKLYNVSCVRDWKESYTKTLYSYEDDQMLIEIRSNKLKLSTYDHKNSTLKFLGNQYINRWMAPEIYVESLISPCF